MARRFAKRERRKHFQATGKILVNAAGPWVEDVLHRAGRNAASRVRLVKGSHIVTRKFWSGDQAYLLQNSDKRVVFVNPYEGDLALIGTTDIPFEGRAEDVRIDEGEVEYLLSVVDRYFTGAPKIGEVVNSFSGVRPLFDDKSANPSAVTRDYVFDVEAPAGPGPDAFGLRRQDHHVPQTCRARVGEAFSIPSADVWRVDGACRIAGRRHS